MPPSRVRKSEPFALPIQTSLRLVPKTARWSAPASAMRSVQRGDGRGALVRATVSQAIGWRVQVASCQDTDDDAAVTGSAGAAVSEAADEGATEVPPGAVPPGDVDPHAFVAAVTTRTRVRKGRRIVGYGGRGFGAPMACSKNDWILGETPGVVEATSVPPDIDCS